MDEGVLKRLHHLPERPLLGFNGEDGSYAFADRGREFGQPFGEALRRCYDFAVTQRERGGPLPSPCVDRGLILGPSEILGECGVYVIKLQGRVGVVPAQHLQGWQVAMLALGEMSKGDLALVLFTVGGDEQEVIAVPRRLLGAVS
ncbi:MAG: hypothetical protein A49_31630 [Methyloceanibacter sp.]|nr:MAG: hypothetical protein A49_31630 [Methyloceanibacter sp.]